VRVDIVPLGPLSSPATLVSEFALAGLFAVRYDARAAAPPLARPAVPAGRAAQLADAHHALRPQASALLV
jgi:hypothetical protein